MRGAESGFVGVLGIDFNCTISHVLFAGIAAVVPYTSHRCPLLATNGLLITTAPGRL